jgi:predicted MFS family arabinose efflux permease
MSEATFSADHDTGMHDAERLQSDFWMQQRNHLFLASCIALIVTAMSFAIRGDAIAALGKEFSLSNEQLGWIALTAFWGFTLAMIFGGPLCDVVGMGRLLWLAMFGHFVGIVSTIFATGFWTLFISTLIFGLANGFVEAACNPLIATLYPDQKIKRLNLFHVWFPGGIVIGGLAAYAITEAGIGGQADGWKWKMATMLIPLAVYAVMFFGRKFPKTERVASGVTTGEMFRECTRPLFLLFVACMLMTAVTELGPQQWFPNILTLTTGIQGVLFLVWITGLMALGRNFAGPIVHRMSPVGMLIGSSIFSAIGLYLISIATTAAVAFVAATIFAVGVCFYWPTMLGVVSERFPKTGALGLAIMGGAGMLASGFIQPIIGHRYDTVAKEAAARIGAGGDAIPPEALAEGGRAALQQVVWLPVVLTFVFAAIYLYDKGRGGYREEVLIQEGQTN